MYASDRKKRKKKKKGKTNVIIGGRQGKYGITRLLKHKDVVQTLENGWRSETTKRWQPALNLPDVYHIHSIEEKEAARRQRRDVRNKRLANATGRSKSRTKASTVYDPLPDIHRGRPPAQSQNSESWGLLSGTPSTALQSTMSPTVASILQRPVTVIRQIPSFPKSLQDFLSAKQRNDKNSDDDNSSTAVADSTSPTFPGRKAETVSGSDTDWLTESLFRSRREARAEQERKQREVIEAARDSLAEVVRRGQLTQASDVPQDGPTSNADEILSTDLSDEMRRALEAGVSPNDDIIQDARILLKELIEREDNSDVGLAKAAEEVRREAEDNLLQQIARSQGSRETDPLEESMKALLEAGAQYDNMVYSAANSLLKVLQDEAAAAAERARKERMSKAMQQVANLLASFEQATGIPSNDLLLWRDPEGTWEFTPSKNSAAESESEPPSAAAQFSQPRSSWHQRIKVAFEEALASGIEVPEVNNKTSAKPTEGSDPAPNSDATTDYQNPMVRCQIALFPPHHDAAALRIQCAERQRRARRKVHAKINDRKNAAATTIQKHVRRRHAVRVVHAKREMVQQGEAATKIQALHRQRQAKSQVHEIRKQKAHEEEEKKQKQKEEQEAAVTKIQAAQRGRVARKNVEQELESKLEQERAATKIQSIHRQKKAKTRVKSVRDEAAAEAEAQRAHSLLASESLRRERDGDAEESGTDEQKTSNNADENETAGQKASNDADESEQIDAGEEARSADISNADNDAESTVATTNTEEADRQSAAEKLQAVQRGRAARAKLSAEQAAAVRVQSVVRGKQARSQAAAKQEMAATARDGSVTDSATDTNSSESASTQDASGGLDEGSEAGSDTASTTTDEELAAATKLQALQRGNAARAKVAEQNQKDGPEEGAVEGNEEDENSPATGERENIQEVPKDEGTEAADASEANLSAAQEEAAALKVQSLVRGKQDRDKIAVMRNKQKEQELQQQEEAAVKVQSVIRGKQHRSRAAQSKAHREQEARQIDTSALKIQSIVRGRQGRRRASDERARDNAVLKIQAASRGHLSRANRRRRRDERHAAAAKAAAAIAIQRTVRAKQARSKVSMLKARHDLSTAEKDESRAATEAAVIIQKVARGRLARKAKKENLSPEEQLWVAAEENDTETMERLRPLLSSGELGIDVRDSEGFTPAMLAANYGSVDFLDALMEFGPDLEAVGPDGSTALLLGAFNGHTDVVDLLLMDAGVNILQKLPNGMTALHIAIQQGHQGIAEVVVDAELELCAQFQEDGREFGGAVVHLPDEKGNSSIHAAVLAKNAALLELLLEVPTADYSSPNLAGDTPLILCAKVGFMDGMRILHGEDKEDPEMRRNGDDLQVDVANEAGYSALEIAARKGDGDMAAWLISALEAVPTRLAHDSLNEALVEAVPDAAARADLLASIGLGLNDIIDDEASYYSGAEGTMGGPSDSDFSSTDEEDEYNSDFDASSAAASPGAGMDAVEVD